MDLLFNSTGGVPVAPGYGVGYPQQYYPGTALVLHTADV